MNESETLAGRPMMSGLRPAQDLPLRGQSLGQHLKADHLDDDEMVVYRHYSEELHRPSLLYRQTLYEQYHL